MKVFVSGPMRGYPDFNFGSFDKARDMLLAEGFEVVSPADLDRKIYGDGVEFESEVPPEILAEMMKRDLEELRKCDAIYMLEGWGGSKGATAERLEARENGIYVFYEEHDHTIKAMHALDEQKSGGSEQKPIDEDTIRKVINEFWNAPLPSCVSTACDLRTDVGAFPARFPTMEEIMASFPKQEAATVGLSSLDSGQKASNPLSVDFSKPLTSDERKRCPLATGVLDYWPDALLAVANCSYVGSQKHNVGQPMSWDRPKSPDHRDAMLRHASEKGIDDDGVLHLAKVAWRAMCALQLEIERMRGQQ